MLRWLWKRNPPGTEPSPAAPPPAELIPDSAEDLSDDELQHVLGGLERAYVYADPSRPAAPPR